LPYILHAEQQHLNFDVITEILLFQKFMNTTKKWCHYLSWYQYCREVMDKSFHECYTHYESTCRTNSHLNGQPMQVRISVCNSDDILILHVFVFVYG